MPGISSCNPALVYAGLDFCQETAFWGDEIDCLPSDDGKSYIMVLGGLGYIGSHTVLELLQEGLNVVVVDDLSNSFKTVLARITTLAQAHCRLIGLIMPALRFHKMDYRNHAMNDLLARNFVFSSSATVYGAKANSGEPLHEEDLLHIDEVQTDKDGNKILRLNGANGLTSPYGRSKYFSEAILADLARADPSMRITALRYFNPVGCHPSGILREDPRQTPTNLFPVVTSVMQGKKNTLEVFGTDWNTRDGTAIRDFIRVDDLARGHVAALTAAASDEKKEPFRAYNLGTGKGMTVAEVLTSFEEASQQQVPAVRAPRRAGDVGSCVAVVDRAERELDWRAVKSVGDCARDCWNALKLPDVIEC
ncbi:hypothetical protein KC332_g589 [Hortaea werneckii]|nr:hypothetical protein KC350_g4893 [Hortaea werneckii]KAI6999444.1 hypothetical protein KC329_g796 [Hortaea werneckii]KAI7274512.1 hypothetical protein KC335_g2401 [Hortaea werneckii]KAI7420878.1 hypothetical protein KC332_g589 [Hortaea werneckii]KAI7448621.1 hypothetical protein KC336_g701 [Hortaea werneckii]